ncbi:hypothetical protein RRG08_051870 [Elysia crispata]|uniref:EGF-like domain-containing protein n=1 Tax=Elysia crispata TaxID=231223 RepID=A0AAE0Z9F0_9GAST|nr:hypothetical protein RRG08_051870 [Elysia crispata]
MCHSSLPVVESSRTHINGRLVQFSVSTVRDKRAGARGWALGEWGDDITKDIRYIPRNDTVFQITIPCKGKEKGVASLYLGLQIYDQNYRPLKGTPIKFRLRKQCEAFVTSSLCKQGCRNGGTCNPHGVCECPQGFRGTLCDIALCSPPCQNNGTCISPSTCACPPGYKGDYCEKAVCGRICQHGGHCLKEGFCWCQPGFFGDGCEFRRKDERPRRSNEPDASETTWPKKKRPTPRKKGRKNLEAKLRRAEQRLLKITARRAKNAKLSPEDSRVIRRLAQKAGEESLSLRERRRIIKVLTGMRKNLTSKDKNKVQRFRSLIRKWKNKPKRQKRKKRPKKRRVYVK